MSNLVNGLFKKTTDKLKETATNFICEATITIYSDRRVTLSYYGKILKFDDCVLIVGNGEKVLKIAGNNLILSEMSSDYLVVDGSIDSVEIVK